MKIFILILLVIPANLYAATLSRLNDGKVQFASATINGIVAWNDAEAKKLINDFTFSLPSEPVKPDPTIVLIQPTTFEILISTSGIRFDNYSDFFNSVDSRRHLNNKILDTKPSIKEENSDSIDHLDRENSTRVLRAR